MRALEAPHIEAFNGNDGCRRDASFIRDLHRRGLLFRRAAFVTELQRHIGKSTN